MRIGFIGAGNMAEALIAGLIKSKTAAPADILISDLLKPRIDELQKKYGVTPGLSNRAVISNSEAIILAVKPKDAGFVRETLTVLRPGSFVISIMAGITTSYFENTDAKIPLLRVMPNTPALVLAGMAAVCKGKYATAKQLDKTKVILGSVGKVVEVEEKYMDAVTAISGSGPAYLFYFAEALLEAAKKTGLDEKTAKLLVENTLLGSAKMLSESTEAPSALRAKVTSPGGTTAAALEVFEKMNFKQIINEAVEAARKKSKEISK